MLGSVSPAALIRALCLYLILYEKIMDTEFLRQLAWLSSIFTPIIWILTIVIHVIFAGAVAHDGGMLHQRGTGTMLVGPIVWAFAVLLG
jgi:hypothetical protein